MRSVSRRLCSVGVIAAISAISVPATKTPRAPVRTTTRTVGSASSSSTISARRRLTSRLRALRRSGRLIVRTAMPSPTRWLVTDSAVDSFPVIGCLLKPVRRWRKSPARRRCTWCRARARSAAVRVPAPRSAPAGRRSCRADGQALSRRRSDSHARRPRTGQVAGERRCPARRRLR